MRILLSNDDGYLAEGIQALFHALSMQHQVCMVAPEQDRSGASNSLTLNRPLRVRDISASIKSVDGTPTDCVHLGITGLLDDEPDMVISGANAGSNLGDDVLYSGTVAAATEGRFLGLPAIAVSMCSFAPKHLDTAVYAVNELLKRLHDEPISSDIILNVNIPDLPLNDIQGWSITRLGHRHKAEPVVADTDPRGRRIYWIGPAGPEEDAGPGTDFYAINQQRISVTPLQVDLTRHQTLDGLSAWATGLGCGA